MCVCVCVYIYIYQPLCTCRTRHKVSFEAEFKKLDFRVFLLLDRLPHQAQSVQLFYPSLEEEQYPRVLALCEMQIAVSIP